MLKQNERENGNARVQHDEFHEFSMAGTRHCETKNTRHCEEQSDEANHAPRQQLKLKEKNAREDKMKNAGRNAENSKIFSAVNKELFKDFRQRKRES